MEKIEVELKFPLLNSEDLIEKLGELAVKGNEDSQKDTYFVPAHRNFLASKPVLEWLRLREADKMFSINYKKFPDKGESVSCEELECNVEDLKTLKNILDRLGFKEIAVVDKKRKIWNYKDVEIAVDSVLDLGDFIELEAKNDFESVEKAEAHLHSVLNELGAEVGEQDFKGYPYLLMEKKGLIRNK